MKARVQGKKTRVANLKQTTEIKKSTVCKSVLKEQRTSLHTGNSYCLSGSNRRCWTQRTRHARDPSPPEVGLDLLCLHPPRRYLPGFLSSPSVSLALPSLQSQPSPSLLSLPYHCLLVLWTSSPLRPEVSGSPSAARAAPARAAGPASVAEQLSSRLQCWSTSSPGSSSMHKQTNYATETELCSKRKWPLDVIA